jgi:hypothetical protein
MNPLHLLGWLQESYPIVQLRGANHLVIEITEVAHVLGLVSFLAATLLLNLRLLNLRLRRQSVPTVAGAAAPLLWGGLGVTLSTGTLLFLSGPVRYYLNPAFQPKMALLAAALLVQLAAYFYFGRREAARPLLARGTAVLSLGLWFGVGLCGRAIGYV